MPTIIGGIFGAIAATLMPNLYLKPVLLISILTISILILVKPEIIVPAPGTPILSPTKHLIAWRGLIATGVYAGFVQAGVGFILLAALAGGLRYDLIRAHALKMACSIAFTTIAIFHLFGQSMVGAGFDISSGLHYWDTLDHEDCC